MQSDIKKSLKDKSAIYIRVSTQFQIDKDSLQVQKRELVAYSELVLGIKQYDIFEDPGYSGKDTSRPAYQQMMVRLRSGEYSHLLVWKIDRISRNLLDFAAMYNELKRIGVTFVSKNEQFDTSTAIGEAMLKIILVFAELERNMTAERVTAIMLSRASNGQWNGGRIPFGYDWDPVEKVFSVNEKEASQYRLICDLYEEHQSLNRVCEELNRLGIKTKTGGPWNPTGARKVMTNVFYKGVYRYNVHSDGKGIRQNDSSEWIDKENHHPALIDEERFDRLSFLLKRNARNGPKPKDTYSRKVVHIYAGLIVCGNCGANVTATQGRRRADGYRPSTYGCSSKRKKTMECSSKFFSDLSVSPIVFAVVSSVLRAMEAYGDNTTEDNIRDLFMSSSASCGIMEINGFDGFAKAIRSGVTGMEYAPPLASGDRYKNDVSALKARKKKYEQSLMRLQSLFLYGDDSISEKDYRMERRRMLDELEKIDILLKDADNAEQELSNEEFREKASYLIMVNKLIAGDPGDTKAIIRSIDPSVPKAFFRRIIDRIVVTDGLVTEIRFKSKLSIRLTYKRA